MWEPRRLTTLWASTAFYSDNFTYFYTATDIKSVTAQQVRCRLPKAQAPVRSQIMWDLWHWSRFCLSISVSLVNSILIDWSFYYRCYTVSMLRAPLNNPVTNDEKSKYESIQRTFNRRNYLTSGGRIQRTALTICYIRFRANYQLPPFLLHSLPILHVTEGYVMVEV
jgi:hypothetical protein